MAYTTKRYVDKTGHVPYTDWINMLLVGGDKSTQKTDLNLAVKYLQDYKTR